jgi:hypothetical protein
VTDVDHPPPTVAVVGAGAGGLMAAEVLAAGGAAVTVYDASAAPGRKLLVAGRGGLNLTHSEPLEQLLTRYGDAAEQLGPAVRAFTPDDLRAWCAGLGQPTFVGSSGRVFPEDFRANRLLDAWLERLDSLGVRVLPSHRWTGWTHDGALRLEGPDGSIAVHPDITVLALGGASWPSTGSDGGWVQVLAEAGISVTPLRPANSGVELEWSELFVERFAGTPVKNVAVRCEGESARGELMVTEHGLEGGAIYALTRSLHDQLDAGAGADLHVDLCPDLDPAAVRARLGRRRAKDSRSTALRRHLGLTPAAVGILREASDNLLPADDDELAALVKDVVLHVTGSAPIDRAISTAGGVAFDEVDEQFMLRRRPGTYVVGEMLDWEAPTGGYLLQATFSTAVCAARAASANGAQHDELG